jgi:hypothetical protein
MRIKRLRFIGNEGPQKWAGAVAEHEEMMAALLKRDAEALLDVIGRTTESTRLRVADVFGGVGPHIAPLRFPQGIADVPSRRLMAPGSAKAGVGRRADS